MGRSRIGDYRFNSTRDPTLANMLLFLSSFRWFFFVVMHKTQAVPSAHPPGITPILFQLNKPGPKMAQ